LDFEFIPKGLDKNENEAFLTSEKPWNFFEYFFSSAKRRDKVTRRHGTFRKRIPEEAGVTRSHKHRGQPDGRKLPFAAGVNNALISLVIFFILF
jgi:hypothetical protein